ncbi:aromatic prenyltransferase, partial [Streptomyces sp. WM6386]|uniref:aromatic prenyltransferase n=1 Tax=Streptomyces sp. WM6386 TaxID=1415558 RepID=UPI000A51DA36
MSGTAQLADLFAGVEESAALIDVSCSREKVWPVLAAYEDALPQAIIAFRVATDSHHEGEFDCRFTLPRHIDPYLRARAHGFITETGRPAESLLADIQRHCPIDSYGIDFGIVGGFRKIWVYFPGGSSQSLAKLRDDLLDAFGDSAQTGKTAGLDFSQHKMTLLLGWAMQRDAHIHGLITEPGHTPDEVRGRLLDTGVPEDVERHIAGLVD